MVEPTEVADEDAVRLGVFDEAEEAGFSRFLDPGRGQKDRNLGFFTDGLDRGGEAAEILKVEIEEVGRLSEEGLGLGRIAAKDGKFDDFCRGPFGNDGGEQLGQLRGSISALRYSSSSWAWLAACIRARGWTLWMA